MKRWIFSVIFFSKYLVIHKFVTKNCFYRLSYLNSYLADSKLDNSFLKRLISSSAFSLVFFRNSISPLALSSLSLYFSDSIRYRCISSVILSSESWYLPIRAANRSTSNWRLAASDRAFSHSEIVPRNSRSATPFLSRNFSTSTFKNTKKYIYKI